MAVSLSDDNYKYALMDQVSQLNGVNFLAFLAAVASHVKSYRNISISKCLQAWTAVPIFREGYANTAVFQLPLLRGSPNEGILQELTRRPLQDWLMEAVERGRVRVSKMN